MTTMPTADQLMQRGLKLTHLRLLSAVAETGQLSTAAAQNRNHPLAVTPLAKLT
jgi:hypothetical protein